MPPVLNLSGGTWWRKNQARYPNSTDTATLEPTFRKHAEAFIQALRASGATVVVSSTRRSPQRAYLMHYAWKIAHGVIKPASVPAGAGVAIEWDHGDDATSRKAAQEMVSLAHMAFLASLTSNHVRGLAVDMTVTWRDELTLRVPGPAGGLWRVAGTPRTGAGNRDLHQVAQDCFGVRKLLSDPPHWSSNGR